MPLLDHFRPPLFPRHRWESFHSNWATRLADLLISQVPSEFLVEENTHVGPGIEIDVATFEDTSGPPPVSSNGGSTATLRAPTYAPPAPAHTIPGAFPDDFEVRVFSTVGDKTLVAVLELVSPSNKDRPAERRAFAAKCLTYLSHGVSLIVMDIVTSRRANLHNETMRLMEAALDLDFEDGINLYAVAYRPVLRDERPEIDLWTMPLTLGEPLPTLPLRLTGDLFVPVDFDAAYQEACRRRRLI